MINRITPIKRAVVMLDQSSGEMRSGAGSPAGIDLWPQTADAFAVAQRSGLEVVLAVPSGFDPDSVMAIGETLGVRVVPLAAELSFSGPGDGLAEPGGDGPATALVSADRRLRGEAARAAMQPAPHVALLPMMMRGEAPEAVRLVGPREVLARLALKHRMVPMHFQPAAGQDWALIALADAGAIAAAVLAGVQLNALPFDAITDDLAWVRIDEDSPAAREALAARRILYAEAGQVLIALAPDEDTEALQVHGAHGHTELLAPSPELLGAAVTDSLSYDAVAPQSLPEDIFERVKLPALDIARIFRPSCATLTLSYGADLDRYTGVTALDANGPIVSRHTAHPDNKRAEAQLLADLRAIGYCAYRHDFTHAGKTHSNIIADLPGTGSFRIRPDILARYLEILRKTPPPKPLAPWASEMPELAQSGWLDEIGRGRIDDRELRRRIEEVLRLRPWYPWWRPLCPVAGFGADLVIVGCHLDSTAGSEPGYTAATDPAPGRDDDGSGLAGVLTLARHLWNSRGRLRHTVRFCFFNAEESGLVGSKAYAAKLKALGAPIRAVVCMDMIGHNSDQNRIFELHVGHTDPAVRDLSVPLAAPIAQAAAAYGQLAPAQVYSGTSWSGAPNRSVFDGAINRSDHAAFQQQGYPAVLVSEDFFANLASEPASDPNPNYHRAADTFVDLAYARDIVCAVAQAVVGWAR